MNAILLTSCKDTHLLKGDEISGIAGAYPIIQENRSLNLDYFLDYPSPEVDLYDLVGEVSLGWYGNDGVSTGKSQEISIGAMLNRRILVELSSALRYYFAFNKYTNKYDKIFISNNIPDSLSLVTECFADSVEFFHSDNEFVRGSSHINGIESFWGYAKTRLVKFKGMDKNMFNLHLKECEFRFNNRGEDMYQILLKIFRNKPLKLS